MTEEEKAATAAKIAAETAAQSSTTVEEIDFDNLDELLGISSSSVIVPDKGAEGHEPTKKPRVFDSGTVDVDFLDDDEEIDNEEELNKLSKDDLEKIASKLLDDDLEKSDEDDDDDDDSSSVNKGGRPSALITAAKSLIEKGILQPFADDKPIEQYTAEDFEELIQANIENKVSDTAQNAPLELFKQLPDDVQAVVHYALNGGTDVKQVMSQVLKAQETFDLDVKNQEDQELIVRQWLNTLGNDTSEEIEDEINIIKDRGDMEKYATKYKPKLDAKQAEIVEQRLKKQQEAQNRKTEQAGKYQQTIYQTLNTDNLNGIPLNNKVQTMLYHGLTDSTKYQNADGKQTNALGFLLEQHQFGEKANPSLVAEALWLLADPENYRDSVKKIGSKEANIKTVRMLKTEEASRNSSSTFATENKQTANRLPKKPLQRTGKSIFSRS